MDLALLTDDGKTTIICYDFDASDLSEPTALDEIKTAIKIAETEALGD